jgi:SNF2 family DNA or RNA helicase
VDEPSLITVGIGKEPHWIEIGRADDVDDNFWYALSVRLGANARPDQRERLEVPVERFLSGRLWLRDHCVSHAVGVQFDHVVLSLLGRARSEGHLVRELLRSDRPAAGVPLPADFGRFSRLLRSFQKRDLAFLLGLSNGANFSVPGAGKTTVTYALYELERLAGRVSRLLVVAPLSAFEAWETEVEDCFGPPPPIVRAFDGEAPWNAEVLLVNYQKLKDPYFERLVAWARRSPTQIVLDEAHRMKRGQLGEWGRACLRLAHVAARRDILTGTPAPHSPRDFVALLDYLWPNQATRTILPAVALQRNPPQGSMELVSRALEPFFVRTTKSELGLMPPRVHTEIVPMGELQAEIYDALRNRYAGSIDLSRTDRTALARMGEVTMYLLEGATNPGLLSGRPHDQGAAPFLYPSLAIPVASSLGELIQTYHRHEVPQKFKRVALMVAENEAQGRKTLVWSNFVGNLLALERVLAPHHPALVYGGISSVADEPLEGVRTRQKELARFRAEPDCSVLLANPAAMGEGVSLHHACHDAIYVDRTFNAGQYLQSLDRIHRLGLPPDVETRITLLETGGSIDEVVGDRLEEKTQRLSAMLDDPDLVTMALPDDEEFGAALEDSEDLRAVLGHLNDA